jgi:hypothetical protein
VTKFDQTVRGKVRKRDGWQCRFCRCRVYNVTPPWAKAWMATFDHLVPQWRGGTETVENMVVSCKACNESKSGEDPTGRWQPKPRPIKPLGQLAWLGDLKSWRPSNDDLKKANVEDDRVRLMPTMTAPPPRRECPSAEVLEEVLSKVS